MHAKSKASSGVCGQRRPRSACASAQSDQGLHCPLTISLGTSECMIVEQMPGRYFVHVQGARVRRHFFALRGQYNAA